MTAAALTHAVPDYEGKLYAATQTMDEARHVEVYERYIRKLAIVYPMSPWLKERDRQDAEGRPLGQDRDRHEHGGRGPGARRVPEHAPVDHLRLLR